MDLEQRFLLVLAEQHDQVLSLKQPKPVQQLLFAVRFLLLRSHGEALHQLVYGGGLLEEGLVGHEYVSQLLGHLLLSLAEVGRFSDGYQLHVYDACRWVDCGTEGCLFEQVYRLDYVEFCHFAGEAHLCKGLAKPNQRF